MSGNVATLQNASVSNIDAVHRLVRDREVLRPGFVPIWRRMAHQHAAIVDEWASTTLELLRVNAGPTCIAAFWQAGVNADIARLRLVIASGHAAADICRHAGARAALACLEALPTAVRLTAADPGDLRAWWHGLSRLAREAPMLVQRTAERVETLLAAGDGMAFVDFIAAGLKATATDKVRRAAFFSLEDKLAQALLARRANVPGFRETERMLGAYVAGLWGGEPRLKAGPLGADGSRRTMIKSGTILMPAVFAGVPAAGVRDLYRAAAAHAQAHLTSPAVRLQVLQLKPLQMALVGLMEDARVETLAIRRHPGLRRLWAGFHVAQPGGAATAVNLMARLARAMLDPEYADGHGFVEKGCQLFFEAADLRDPSISRAIGTLLGNDLGQMRVQFNAKTYVMEPAYRDDNMHLWVLPETPDDALSMTVDTARGTDGDKDGDKTPGDGPPAPRARDSGRDDRGLVLATYPEWDSVARVERPDWTTLRDTLPLTRDPGPIGAAEATVRARVARLVRSSVVGQSVRQNRREDGEELDIDAAIAAAIAKRAGVQPDGRVYRDRRPCGRDLSTLIILDVSQSTAAAGPAGQSILTTERLAVAALAAALEARGDRFALRAFASSGRDDVRLTRLKDFDEPLTPAISARLAGLSSGLSTRLGAALRHAGAELVPLRTTRKLVLVLTDGEPSDIDVTHPQELVEDARRAVLGLRLKGVDVFGIVMDPEKSGSGPAIFGRHNTIPVRRLEELPAKLAGVYFRLAQR